VRPDWMRAESMRTAEVRAAVGYLKEVAAELNVGLADASRRWAHLWVEGLPYITLLYNGINHPDDRGHQLFVEELKTFFRRWERHRLRLKRKRVIKRPLFLKRRVRDILIVEDEKDLCELLSDVLRPKRYNVSVANTKKEAMASLKRSPPDLVFLDLKLPDGDGMDLISKIKKTNPKTTINIISAYGSEESKEAAKKKGVYNFIDKPFTEKEILTNIK